MDRASCARVRGVMLDLTEDEIAAQRATAMSDPLFALELAIAARLAESLPPAWHVDRSRNDVQACAQLMLGREQMLATAAGIRSLAHAACTAAERHPQAIMPGVAEGAGRVATAGRAGVVPVPDAQSATANDAPARRLRSGLARRQR